ncbi:BMP family ABC transporter substrate-binding protein [Clostridium sp. B9]|uniref:BMP family lipoprotein n=1 Tax=Clostridium sp. B9 TaxID=3423224 RepID=UPI003D2ECC11
MKKKVLSAILAVITTATLIVGCGGSTSEGQASSDSGTKEKLKVGMVTDSGTIDDKSFNQGTWEGIKKAEKELGVEAKYVKPTGETESDYLKEIGNLYDAGFKFIVTPGFKFETAIYKAQTKYPEGKFVLLDGSPHSGEKGAKADVAKNTVSIHFAEQQAGFMAGVATALQLKEGALGFIGGMQIPPVQKFNWGFQQGVDYANKNLGTKMTIDAKDVVYQGSFNDSAAGGQIAAHMFDSGVKAIFCAAGGVGVGAIQEAKNRTASGKQAWIIGVDVDQYNDGIYEGDKSVILTSAVKRIGNASYDMIKDDLDGKFPGGQTLMYDASNNGVGLPEKNPNLSEETIKKANEVYEKLKNGDIKVSAEQGDLIK